MHGRVEVTAPSITRSKPNFASKRAHLKKFQCRHAIRTVKVCAAHAHDPGLSFGIRTSSETKFFME